MFAPTLDRSNDFTDQYIDDEPISPENGVILRRTAPRMEMGSETFTNVPHYVVLHSPTGYEWGYMGSGPADLALNIMEHFLRHIIQYDGPRESSFRGECFILSRMLHQDFKFKFLGKTEMETVIPFHLIVEFIKHKMERMELPVEMPF